MSSALSYLNSSIISSTDTQSSVIVSHDSIASSLKQSKTFIVQSPSRFQKELTLLSKRNEPVQLEDLLIKKIKTKNVMDSDLDVIHQSQKSEGEVRTIGCSNELRLFSREQMIDNESSYCIGLNTREKMILNQIQIPPFEEISQRELPNGESIDQPLRRLNYSSAPIQVTSQENLSAVLIETPQESSQLVLKALAVLRLKLMAYEATISSSNTNLISIKPLNSLPIPPFSSCLADVSTPLEKSHHQITNKKVQEELNVTYGSIQFPLLQIPPAFNREAKIIKSNTSSLEKGFIPETLAKAKESRHLSSSPSENDEIVNEAIEAEKNDSLTATRTGTQRSESEIENCMVKSNSIRRSVRILTRTKKIRKNPKKSCKKIIEKIPKSNCKDPKKANKNDREKTNNKKGEQETKKLKGNEKKVIRQELLVELYPAKISYGQKRCEAYRNKWQLSQSEKLNDGYSLEISNKRNNEEIKTVKQIKIGTDYQVVVLVPTTKRDNNQQRKPIVKWDPSSQTQDELQQFFMKIKAILNTDISEEKALMLMVKNSNDCQKTLTYIENNRDQCLGELTLKTERS